MNSRNTPKNAGNVGSKQKGGTKTEYKQLKRKVMKWFTKKRTTEMQNTETTNMAVFASECMMSYLRTGNGNIGEHERIRLRNLAYQYGLSQEQIASAKLILLKVTHDLMVKAGYPEARANECAALVFSEVIAI